DIDLRNIRPLGREIGEDRDRKCPVWERRHYARLHDRIDTPVMDQRPRRFERIEPQHQWARHGYWLREVPVEVAAADLLRSWKRHVRLEIAGWRCNECPEPQADAIRHRLGELGRLDPILAARDLQRKADRI